MKTRILFVDDEPRVLSGLRRMLFGQDPEWETLFANSGPEALEIMAREAVDVLVTDMRMPGMDGAQLMHRVKDLHPGAIRIALSGYSDQETLQKAMLPAHQYLAKPVEPERLVSVIRHSLRANALLSDARLRTLIARIETMPSLPELYHSLMNEISKESPSLDKVAAIVESDPGMTANILKVVNSAYFGFSRKITTPISAVNLLGLKTLHSLVLTAHLFSQHEGDQAQPFSLQKLWEHSLRVSRLAEHLTLSEGGSRGAADNALMAGLLHDVGKIVLVNQLPEEYACILEQVRQEGLRPDVAEARALGVSHAQVGAFLLGLWGMPEEVVEAVARHHDPERQALGMDLGLAVLVSNILDHRNFVVNAGYQRPEFPGEALAQAGLQGRMEAWDDMAQELLAIGPDTCSLD
jgi:putative nucleotidyltransferase with HDIG domain